MLCVRIPRLCKKYTRSERARLCRSGYVLKYIVPRLFENYTRCERACLHSSRYALEYTVPRLCQKYTCSEWAWLYASGYPLKCIVPLFPIGTRNLHSSPWARCKSWLVLFSVKGSQLCLLAKLISPKLWAPVSIFSE